MSLLQETVAKIHGANEHVKAMLAERLEKRMPQSESLGVLRNMLLTYVGAVNAEVLPATKKLTIIACADHGVAAQNVSAYPQKTTYEMTANYLISRGGAANAMANFAGSDLIIVDMGINADTTSLPGLINKRIASGTKDSSLGAAMTRAEAEQAVASGIELVNEYAAQGYNVFLPGEMGIANTTASAAIATVLCGIDPTLTTGRGTGINDERLQHKTKIVRKILDVNKPNPADGLDVLTKVGGFELGCITGIILGAAANDCLVVLDGFNTGAAALIAQKLAPQSIEFCLASALSAEEGHSATIKQLGLHPFMTLHFRLGEACASSVAAGFLDAAINIAAALSEDCDEDAIAKNDDLIQETLADIPETLSDATFNFYTNTMPVPDKNAMQLCRERLDNLAKPRHSMGFLEEIAAQTAGLFNDERPEADNLLFGMLLFCNGARKINDVERRLIHGFIECSCDEMTLFPLEKEMTPTVSFGCGRAMGEDISFRCQIMGLALLETNGDDEPGTKARRLQTALTDETGRIVSDPDVMLKRLPKDLRRDFAAVLGAIISAAHNSSLIITDDEGTEIIARCAQKLCPDVRPYILHVQPKILQTNITYPVGIAATLGMLAVNAALYMLNDMKTFAETGVSLAE